MAEMLVQGDACRIPLADESVDLVFTDPPYAKVSLPCYERLANESARLLKPGGFVVAMTGGNYNGPIHSYFLSAGLTCFFDIAYVMGEDRRASGYLPHIGVLVRSKFLLSYSKGRGKLRVMGMHNLYAGRRDKRYHHWGQAVDYARYYIDHFCPEGGFVLDPFVGGGTTGIACQLLGRRFVGMDLNWTAMQMTKHRLQNSDAVVQAGMLL